MSMNLTPEKFSCEPEYLLAGTDIRVTTAIKKAAAALKAGAPVKLDSSGKAAPVAKADGTTDLYGITTEDFKSGKLYFKLQGLLHGGLHGELHRNVHWNLYG